MDGADNDVSAIGIRDRLAHVVEDENQSEDEPEKLVDGSPTGGSESGQNDVGDDNEGKEEYDEENGEEE